MSKKFKISEVNQIGKIVFKKGQELVVEYTINDDCVSYRYDFGMEDGTLESITVKEIKEQIEFDLAHAFHHIKFDPNYSYKHWALYGNLKDRVDLFDE